MASSKLDNDEPPLYHPLPLASDHHQQNYVVLPVYIPALLLFQYRRRRLICAATLLLLAAAVFSAWPSDPYLKIVRLRLDRVHVRTVPSIALDVAFDLTVKVRNPDLYSIDYESVDVAIGYRGKRLGLVTSDGGHVRARGSSYVDATLRFDGVEVLSDVFLLLEDLARGSVPFDTVTEIRGHLGFFFAEIPLKSKVSCEVYVNTRNQTIARQNCY